MKFHLYQLKYRPRNPYGMQELLNCLLYANPSFNSLSPITLQNLLMRSVILSVLSTKTVFNKSYSVLSVNNVNLIITCLACERLSILNTNMCNNVEVGSLSEVSFCLKIFAWFKINGTAVAHIIISPTCVTEITIVKGVTANNSRISCIN